jgi:predicted Zn-ribbon and HTH transcriptional regulator
MSEEDNEAFEALGLAIKALSMQIPKKFNKSHICNGSESDYIVFNIYECTCPNCGFLFRTLINNQKHCHNCGQKLDWN